MSFPQVKGIYDHLPLAESIQRQISDLVESGGTPTSIKVHPETAKQLAPIDGLQVLADSAMKPGTVRILVTW